MSSARSISTTTLEQASRLGTRDRIVALGRALRQADKVSRDQMALMLIEMAAHHDARDGQSGPNTASGPIELIARIPVRWRSRHADEALLALARAWSNLSAETRPLALALGRDRWLAAATELSISPEIESRIAAVSIAHDSADPGLGKVVCALLRDEEQRVRKAADETLLRMALRLLAHLPPQLLGEHYAAIARIPVDALPSEPEVLELERCVLLSAISDAAWGFASHRCRSPLIAALLLMDRSIATPMEREITIRMKRLLSEREHPSHAPLRSVLKRTDCPLLRERALRWLPISPISTAALDRLCSTDSTIEHEIVLSKSTLALRPARADKLAALARMRGGDKAMGFLPKRSEIGSLTERSRIGLIAMSSLIAEDDATCRARLEPLLADESPRVRLHSAALCSILDLQDYLFDPDPFVARHAATRWTTIGIDPPRLGSPSGAVRVRLCAQNTRSPHATLRRMASEELARLTIDDAANPVSRQRARRLLEADPAAFTRALRDRLSIRPSCESAIAMIRALGVERRFELDLIGVVQGENQPERARASAVAALARVDSNASRYVLSEALSDRDQRTRANAVECIEIEPVKLVEYKDDDNHRVRANAVRRLILANNGTSTHIDRAANDSLIELIGDPRPMHRLAGTWVAQRTIAQQHREKLSKSWRPVISQLEELAAIDQDERLRARAARCIRRLGAEIQSAPANAGNVQG